MTAAVVTTPGVIRIVGDGARPLPIPAEEIEAIGRIVDAGSAVEPWHYLQVGRRVRVEFRPLRGTEGIIVTTRPGRNDPHVH